MTLLPQQILTQLGQAFAITGLILVMPYCFAFRSYLRFLDNMQFIYIYALILATADVTFSINLSNSWVAWDKNIFFFCSSGEFVCIAGFPLSFGACLLIFLLVMRVIVAIETCRKKQLRFQPVYTFFKGLTRWIYAPLSYWSINYLIKSIKNQSQSIISSVVIVSICIIFPIAQLIGYKLIQTQKDDIWRKWLQFINFIRILFICGLMAIGYALQNQIPYYFIYGVYIVYAVLFGVKNNFLFKVVGRIVFVVGEVIMIGIFSLFLFKKDYVVDYNLDFILTAVLFVMDLVYSIVQLVTYYRKGVPPQADNQRVNPQPSQQKLRGKKRNNSYQVDLNDIDNQFNNSRQDLTKQISSPPAKNNKSPARRR